jgi:hypothetical protein
LRNRVERCFNKLKNSRRLATRYDKTTASYLGFVQIAAIRSQQVLAKIQSHTSQDLNYAATRFDRWQNREPRKNVGARTKMVQPRKQIILSGFR